MLTRKISEEMGFDNLSLINHKVKVQGRLLGGWIDTIRHLISTSFGDVQYFKDYYITEDSVTWFLENCELTTTDLLRLLIQMKLAGWFNNCNAIIFRRSSANTPIQS